MNYYLNYFYFVKISVFATMIAHKALGISVAVILAGFFAGADAGISNTYYL